MFSVITVDSEHLAPLLLCDADLEPVPEPIRMQPDLHLRIPFEEYIAFCKDWVAECNFLYYPTQDMIRFLREEDLPSLRKAFFFDVALAVSKELWYAYYREARPTNISHYYNGCVEQRSPSSFIMNTDSYHMLCSAMEDRKYRMPTSLPHQLLDSCKYACYLFQSAITGDTEWAT